MEYLLAMLIRPAALVITLLSGVLAQAQWSGTRPVATELELGWSTINTTDARSTVEILAGPHFRGRGTGQPGYQMAAAWVAGKFAELGLEPLGDDGGYFQQVPFTRVQSDPAVSRLTLGDVELRQGEELGFRGFAEATSASGPLAFVGLGQGQNALPQDLDLAGRVVVVTSNEGGRRALFALFNRRPAMVLQVAERPESPETFVAGRSFPSAQLTASAAAKLAEAAGVDGELPSSPGIRMGRADAQAKIEVGVLSRSSGQPNVIAVLPGSDPTLASEAVILSGHLDHMGEMGDQVYWGADDNASGIAAMLLAARALVDNPLRPKRSVIFMAFAAEEMGLIGSRYYVEHPKWPLAKTKLIMQMDMVGRNEEDADETSAQNENTTHAVGKDRLTTELGDALRQANEHIGFVFEDDAEDLFFRSDHAPFVQKGVVGFLLITGLHPDYHQPSDIPDKINYEKLCNAARLAYLVAHSVGARTQPWKLNEQAGG